MPRKSICAKLDSMLKGTKSKLKQLEELPQTHVSMVHLHVLLLGLGILSCTSGSLEQHLQDNHVTLMCNTVFCLAMAASLKAVIWGRSKWSSLR